ncbi:hypothetical protein OJF2_48880 [Aquisphaera giovannonii]|uniref:Zeta toxin n=1 Tax=Aquisphaera giovannonii TaxID=406548 RepID=A0A5B9W7K4_9BACT|nr:ATP-binding protein [Aquisphaera giovannonii]QEH36327.1 hypothetical protein OJF2_48880 [Aquisphaera giovannonii]
MEVVLFVGLQGSGKSTFYRERFAGTHVHVSKDNFRSNRRPHRRQMALIEGALDEGRSVVVDNTNATVEDRAAIIAAARAHGASVIGIVFEAPLADCLERNGRRAGKQRVPDAAIFATRKRLRPPTMAEGFDQLRRVRLERRGDATFAFIEESLP